MQPRIEIYLTNWCPFCIRAKRLLDKKGVMYEAIDVDQDPELRQTMMQRANGGHTVPQIFIDDRHIGGCDDLHALDAQGKLDPLLGKEASSEPTSAPSNPSENKKGIFSRLFKRDN